MGRPYDIPAFAPHLKAFTEIDRGNVLRKDGVPRRYRYRFRNPLLQPFSILSALTEGVIPTTRRSFSASWTSDAAAAFLRSWTVPRE